MIIKDKISQEGLEKIFKDSFETMIKVVVDIEKGILSAGCEFHIECAEDLVNNEDSKQKNLWGANFYYDKNIDFVSLINIKPGENKSMEIKNPIIKQKVENIIRKLLCN